MEKKTRRRKYYKEDKIPSSYELDIKINENYYQSHFDSIKTAKFLITEAQKTMNNSTNDSRIEKISRGIIKKMEKHLTELENKTPKVKEFYERTKRYLESLR